jgi:hypothetical protein
MLRASKDTDALLSQWYAVFDIGHDQGPPVAITTGIVHALVAYAKFSAGRNPMSSVLAAVLTPSIYPYTVVTMVWLNENLIAAMKAGAGHQQKPQLIRYWVMEWGRRNLFRGLLPLSAGIFSLIGLMT